LLSLLHLISFPGILYWVMSERAFQILEHTADKGIAATGKTMAEAFETAAYGMFSLIADIARYQPTTTRRIVVAAEDREQLLWTWLSELLFNFEVEKQFPLDFRIVHLDDRVLRADVAIRPVGSDIEWLGSAVKAVTYHQLKVEETPDGWRVQVYVDV
jgi:SHS2 domain-containing protein